MISIIIGVFFFANAVVGPVTEAHNPDTTGTEQVQE